MTLSPGLIVLLAGIVLLLVVLVTLLATWRKSVPPHMVPNWVAVAGVLSVLLMLGGSFLMALLR